MVFLVFIILTMIRLEVSDCFLGLCDDLLEQLVVVKHLILLPFQLFDFVLRISGEGLEASHLKIQIIYGPL